LKTPVPRGIGVFAIFSELAKNKSHAEGRAMDDSVRLPSPTASAVTYCIVDIRE